MQDGVPIMGSIGAMNESLSMYVLNTEDLKDEIVDKMRRRIKIVQGDGKIEVMVDNTAKAYTTDCISWMVSKVTTIVNKNTYLSQIQTEQQASELIFQLHKSFLFELLSRVKDFNLTPNQFSELGSMHLSYSYFGIMRALYQSDKKFLGSTNTETTQNIQQRVIEEQDSRKGGPLDNIFKR